MSTATATQPSVNGDDHRSALRPKQGVHFDPRVGSFIVRSLREGNLQVIGYYPERAEAEAAWATEQHEQAVWREEDQLSAERARTAQPSDESDRRRAGRALHPFDAHVRKIKRSPELMQARFMTHFWQASITLELAFPTAEQVRSEPQREYLVLNPRGSSKPEESVKPGAGQAGPQTQTEGRANPHFGQACRTFNYGCHTHGLPLPRRRVSSRSPSKPGF